MVCLVSPEKLVKKDRRENEATADCRDKRGHQGTLLRLQKRSRSRSGGARNSALCFRTRPSPSTRYTRMSARHSTSTPRTSCVASTARTSSWRTYSHRTSTTPTPGLCKTGESVSFVVFCFSLFVLCFFLEGWTKVLYCFVIHAMPNPFLRIKSLCWLIIKKQSNHTSLLHICAWFFKISVNHVFNYVLHLICACFPSNLLLHS